MGLFGKSKKELQDEISRLEAELSGVKSAITPEMKDVIVAKRKLAEINDQISDAENAVNAKKEELGLLEKNIADKQKELLVVEDDVAVQEFGLYTPKFDFVNSDEYKNALIDIRAREKEAIKNGDAIFGNPNWTVNGNRRQGNKMVKDTQKLLLRAFNVECDEAINKVKYNNFDLSERRIRKSCETISKLGIVMSISISDSYLKMKLDELHLAFEYAQKKQEEKEAIREARAEMREAAKLQKEIEEQRKAAEKEQKHYENALASILKQIKQEGELDDLLNKKNEIQNHLHIIEENMKELDYREANKRAGYVYVISNIGAFGQDIYKIGMTRRLDPQERVDELGDASVPFKFDVHAMIFSDDAPSLENALHKAFEDRKVNMINQRREFFHVSLDEIKKVVKDNYDKTVEFKEVPDAEQYRETQKIIEAKQNH